MDKELLNEMMFLSVQKTVESLAFAEVYTAQDGLTDKTAAKVSIGVDSPAQGEFTLIIDTGVISVIAQNLFSQPADAISPEKIDDLLSELLNTIAGSFLGKSLSEETAFSLGLPKVNGAINIDNLSDVSLQWHFTLDEMPFSIYLDGGIVKDLQ